MKNICVIFGGKSVENEVSIVTAKQVMQNFDFTKYKMYPVFIDQNQKWWSGKNFDDLKTFRNFNPKKHKRVTFQTGSNGLNFNKKFVKIDCAVVCCHGTFGEDGCLQGLLNLIDIPYTSCGVETSAICMNKITMKKMFEYLGLPITKYVVVDKKNLCDLKQISSKLNFPVFVKPANLGSSIGIAKCKTFEETERAVNIAFNFDNKVLIEEGVENLVEYNCSSMIIKNVVCASQIEMPHTWSDFLNFEDKYIKKGKKFGRKITKVNIGKRLEQKIKDMTKLVHSEFDLQGVVRTDFLYDKLNKKLYINEINTIPGSLAYYLWKSEKMSFRDVLDNLIENAIQKSSDSKKIITNFDSNILDK